MSYSTSETRGSSDRGRKTRVHGNICELKIHPRFTSPFHYASIGWYRENSIICFSMTTPPDPIVLLVSLSFSVKASFSMGGKRARFLLASPDLKGSIWVRLSPPRAECRYLDDYMHEPEQH